MNKIYNCNLLNSGLHFTPDNLRFCCAPAYWGPNIDSKNPGEKDVFLALMNKRTNAIQQMRNHIAPDGCLGCIYLKEYDLDSSNTPKNIIEIQSDKPKISNIVINHYKQCDCHCIYCTQSNYLKKIVTIPQKSDYYDLYPIIKSFYNEDLIDTQNLRVEFQGGSLAILEEFHDLVDIFLQHGIKEIQFFTNGIKYLPEIVEASNQAHVDIICSLDSGTRETFKRIKIVDKFNDVINNLKKYRKKSKNLQIFSKYILLEGINDNIEELSKYLEASENFGADIAQLDMDFKKVMINKGVHYDVPKHFYKLYDFFKEQCSKMKIRPFIWEYIQKVLDKGYFE
ncbi:radical SAM protein [bacterium]|nr:radical SAM protein [bacterium]